MRQLILIAALLLACCVPASAQTLLRAYSYGVASTFPVRAQRWSGIGCARTTGAPFNYQTVITSSSYGSGQLTTAFAPTATAPPCVWQLPSAQGYAYPIYVSAPISSGATISSNVSGVCSTVESSNALNAGCMLQLWKIDGRTGGWSFVWEGSTAEMNSSACAQASISGSAPTSTVVATGDRLAWIPWVINVGGNWGGNGTRTATLCTNGTSGQTTYHTYVSITETMTTGADDIDLRQEQVSRLNPFTLMGNAEAAYAAIAYPLFWQPTIWQAELLALNSLQRE